MSKTRFLFWAVCLVAAVLVGKHLERENTLAPLVAAFQQRDDPAINDAWALEETPATKSESPSAPPELRVLFIGNSLTHTQAIPKMLATMAREAGHTIEVAQSAPPGYRLVQHLGEPRTLQFLREGGWDVVVLQEQSQHPGFTEEQVRRDVDPYLIQLAQMARAGSPSARVILYMTPAHRNGDLRNAPNDAVLGTYEGMQNRIANTYRRLGREANAHVAPAGVAWQTTRRLLPSVNLYYDDSHPNREGAYLIACVFYAKLFAQSPAESPFLAGVDPQVASSLQQIAWETVRRER